MNFRKVELIIPGNLKDEPIFYYIIKNFKVIPNVMEASFSTEMGWVVARIEGKDAELDRLFKALREKGIRVNPR